MTQAAVGSIAPLVTVGGKELSGAELNALIGLHISSGLRIASRARLEFLDDGFGISAGGAFKLGDSVTVKLADGTALFTGDVTGVELDVERGAPNLCVIADDSAYKMTLGTTVRTFTKVTYAEIVTTIAREYTVPVESTPTSAVQEYILQTDTDFGFLNEIADRAGYDWWVDATGKLQFHPMGSQREPIPEVGWVGKHAGLQHFSVRASALHPQQVTMSGWDPDTQQVVESTSGRVPHLPDAHLVTPFLVAGDLASRSAVRSAHQLFTTQGDGKAMADSAATRSLAGAVIATGVCEINPHITVGRPVTVSDVGPASGTYPVTEVEHSYTKAGFNTTFTAGDREPTTLVDTLRAPSASSFRQDALVVGVVTNLGSAESPKGYVKVRYPTLGSQVESAWARVVSTGAGNSRGMTFLPEVNDEVIVGFEGGDVARPLILGGVYSGRSAALDYGSANGTVAKRQIVSRLGHVIELGDGDSAADQHIWLTLAGGEFAIKLGKDGLAATVPEGQPVAISAGSTKIEFDKQGNISIAGKKISITAEQDVEISGMNVKAKAKSAVEASGMDVKASGSTSASLSSSGQTAVKGSVVMIN